MLSLPGDIVQHFCHLICLHNVALTANGLAQSFWGKLRRWTDALGAFSHQLHSVQFFSVTLCLTEATVGACRVTQTPHLLHP